MQINVIEGGFGKTANVTDIATQDTETTVAYLNDAIRLARENRAVCCAVIILSRDGAVIDGWSAVEQAMRPFVMAGAMEALKLRYMRTHIEGLS